MKQSPLEASRLSNSQGTNLQVSGRLLESWCQIFLKREYNREFRKQKPFKEKLYVVIEAGASYVRRFFRLTLLLTNKSNVNCDILLNKSVLYHTNIRLS